MEEKVKDPVCGMEVEKGNICSSYEGNKYCFCSPACKEKFDANPTEYIGGGEKGGCCE